VPSVVHCIYECPPNSLAASDPDAGGAFTPKRVDGSNVLELLAYKPWSFELAAR